MKAYEKLLPGDGLLDMHDVGRHPADLENSLWIKEPHKVIQRIVIDAPNGVEFIRNALAEQGIRKTVTNKILTVIHVNHGAASKPLITAAWSYDDRTFGLMTIQVDTA